MPRLDHAAFETPDPDALAAFYERILGARVVKTEGHPVMAYVGNTGYGRQLEAITYRGSEDPRRR
jgi:catechol 2,3-dioxygenase-like lactoylglutathione lyase family enzyme